MKTIKRILFLLVLVSSGSLIAQDAPFQVSVKGTGEPILLFPGFACTGQVWDDTVQQLSKDYECHVFTFAGFGEVPAIETPWLPKIKEGVLKYIADKKLKTPTLIGHSMGGTLALWLATESDAYKQLILVDALASTGALMMPNFKSEYMVYDSPYNQQMLEMSETDFEIMAKQMAAGMTTNTEKQKVIEKWMQMANRETYVDGYTDLLKLDLRDDIANISVPTTILAATIPYGNEMAQITYLTKYKNLPSYKIEFPDNSAQLVMSEQPE